MEMSPLLGYLGSPVPQYQLGSLDSSPITGSWLCPQLPHLMVLRIGSLSRQLQAPLECSRPTEALLTRKLFKMRLLPQKTPAPPAFSTLPPSDSPHVPHVGTATPSRGHEL